MGGSKEGNDVRLRQVMRGVRGVQSRVIHIERGRYVAHNCDVWYSPTY